MIIVWVNKREWKKPGPIVNMAVHNAHSFSAIGLESHLVIGAGKDSDTAQDLVEFYGLEVPPHFHVHRVHRKASWWSAASAEVYKSAKLLIDKLAQKDDVAVFTRESGFLPYLWRWRHHARIRGFYELHDFYADLRWRENRVTFKDRREQFLERIFLPGVDGLVCITPDQESLYRRIFPQVSTIAQSLGTKPMAPQEVEVCRKRRTVVYVGHMHGSKGVAFLSEASVILAQRNIRTLFMGGYPANAERLLANAAKHGVADRVECHAFLPPQKMHALLAEKASLGVVMLSDNYYNRHLTCPVKALDYLSHGLPSVGTDIPSVRAVLADACLYLPPNDMGAFVGAVEKLLDDPEAYAEAASLTRSRALEMTWLKRAKNLAEWGWQSRG